MKLFQSFWTKPAITGTRWGISQSLEANLWVAALSLAYANRLGQGITMHTDSIGAELFKDFPYTDIKLSLDEMPEDWPKYIWAAGKFFALKNEELGATHIDTDVVLSKQLAIDAVNVEGYDLVIQNTEWATGAYDKFKHVINNIIPKEICDVSYGRAFNVGTIGFGNQKLKDEYLNRYFKACDIIRNNPGDLKYLCENNQNFCIDLTLEQKMLFQIAVELGSLNDGKVKQVIPDDAWYSYMQGTAKYIGYTHFIGQSKYFQLDKIKEQLKKIDENLYITVEKLINK